MPSLIYKNTAIHYSDFGQGAAVVLLHGFLENQGMWSRLTKILIPKYRVITIDLLGHGQTSPVGYLHSMEQNAEIVQAVLRELRIRKVWLGGHSMGGYVALAFAESNAEMVKGLMLINSTAAPDSKERQANRNRAISAVKKDHSTFVRLSISNLFSEENRERLKDAIEHVRGEALKTPLQGIVASLEGMKIRKDRMSILQNSQFPVLLILGKKDPVLSVDEIVDQVKDLPVQTKIMSGGHMSHLENEAELTEEVLRFLS